MKKFLSFLSLALFASGFNTLYKYMTVQNDLLSYNSSMFDSYLTTSSSGISYINIFLYTFFLSILFLGFIYFLFRKADISIVLEIKYIACFIALLIISVLVLFFNPFMGFVVLIISCFLFVYRMYKDLENKKIVIVLLFFLILYFSIFYYISL